MWHVCIQNYGYVSELSSTMFISWIRVRIFDHFTRIWLQSPLAISLPNKADKTDLSTMKTQAASGKKGCDLQAVSAPGGLN